MKQYVLKKSEQVENGWVLTDTRSGLVCRFIQHQFNETQKFTFLDDDQVVLSKYTEQEIAKMANDMTAWAVVFHYNILMPEINMPLGLKLGRQIGYYRKELGLSQQHMAELCGLDLAAVSGVEDGSMDYPLEVMAIILSKLGKTLEIVER